MKTIDMAFELIIIVKLLVAFLLGSFIGYDREKHGADAGIRTYAAVCVGATLFTAIANHIINDPAAVSRIIANIITGVGFLGAGIIYQNHASKTSHGLTTAATLWCTSAVGVAVGLNMFIIAVAGACALYFLLSLHHQRWYVKWKKGIAEKPTSKNDSDITN
ncbi:MgtC/SapB family protein [Sediminibacterium ginsengisoli]|uniref:Putative Mg2+ transporter-C (MgtC) family protein n=1 Tax=Sediminibacterium ginsengisoli TaxID=413434 RepID=A0A1T4P306_9BACT|nr:MgtC/SapB family protein [Sediminibacterium ginsengisoli]SJZ85697.1 putative Mg2+ transporter-C (MgtC) family protein [Sediminibacterium ginsengisoli]